MVTLSETSVIALHFCKSIIIFEGLRGGHEATLNVNSEINTSHITDRQVPGYWYGTMQKKGDNLFAKVRDIFSSRKDSRAGCNQYAMLTQFAMCLSV